MKPNFIIIGAARSGTTSLHKYLEAHPDIFMSETKEINYFSNPKIYTKGDAWYLRHFSKSNHKIIGEASTSYSVAPYRHDVPKKIIALLGQIKIVYILRDPVDRLVSHYLHYVHRGEVRESFSEIVSEKQNPMLKQGCYSYQLKQYLPYFPQENIHLLTIDQLKNKPDETVKSLYRFLDVDDQFREAKFDERHNANIKITKKGQLGQSILSIYHNFIEQKAFPYPLKSIFLWLAELDSQPMAKPLLDNGMIEDLIAYYSGDIKELVIEFGLNINGWREYF